MIQFQETIIDGINSILTVLDNVEINKGSLIEIRDIIDKQDLLIPVVGEFSAGKSSLLNNFLGNNILPTAINPETALAAELRYSSSNYIEAIRSTDGGVDSYSIEDFNQINEKADDYEFLRVYLENDNLKAIEPIILVDMPGFESSRESHNKAIKHYINKGAYFIVLANAKDGDLKKSTIRNLKYLKDFNRDFSLILSKSNLVTTDDLNKVIAKVELSLEKYVGVKKEIISIGNKGKEELLKIIEEINPDELFKSITKDYIYKGLFNFEDTINLKINSLNRNSEENEKVIYQLKNSIAEVNKTKEELINKRNEMVSHMVSDVSQGLNRDLTNAQESLITMAISGGPELMQEELESIVQTSISHHLNDSASMTAIKITDSISTRISEVKQTVDSGLQSFNVTFDAIKDNVLAAVNFQMEQNKAKKEVKKIEEGKNIAEGASSVATVAAVVAASNPWVEAGFMVGSIVIKFVADLVSKKMKEEKIRELILIDVIPRVKRDIQSKLPSLVGTQLDSMIEQSCSHYEKIIEEKQAEIEAAEKERNDKHNEVEAVVSIFEESKQIIENVLNSCC